MPKWWCITFLGQLPQKPHGGASPVRNLRVPKVGLLFISLFDCKPSGE